MAWIGRKPCQRQKTGDLSAARVFVVAREPLAAHPLAAHPLADRAGGFTLIELMVVIAIIVMAAGLMTPTITEFFRNRQLENFRSTLGAAINSARLRAVSESHRVSVVFFLEGSRIYDEREKRFVDELFNPETSPTGRGGQVWYELGFLGSRRSELMPYRVWEKRAKGPAVDARKRAAANAEQVIVEGLPKITFERDGSLKFGGGADVSSAVYKEKVPRDADILICQAGNNTVCFVDLRPPGQMRSKIVAVEDPPKRPPQDSVAEDEGGGSDGARDAAARASEDKEANP